MLIYYDSPDDIIDNEDDPSSSSCHITHQIVKSRQSANNQTRSWTWPISVSNLSVTKWLMSALCNFIFKIIVNYVILHDVWNFLELLAIIWKFEIAEIS